MEGLTDCPTCAGSRECAYCAHVRPGPCRHCAGLRICGACATPRSKASVPRVGVGSAISPMDVNAEEFELVRRLLGAK